MAGSSTFVSLVMSRRHDIPGSYPCYLMWQGLTALTPTLTSRTNITTFRNRLAIPSIEKSKQKRNLPYLPLQKSHITQIQANMVKRKAEVDADASRAPARRSSRNKPGEDNVKSEEPSLDQISAPKPKPAATKAKKSSKKDDVKVEVEVGHTFLLSLFEPSSMPSTRTMAVSCFPYQRHHFHVPVCFLAVAAIRDTSDFPPSILFTTPFPP